MARKLLVLVWIELFQFKHLIGDKEDHSFIEILDIIQYSELNLIPMMIHHL